MSHLQKPRLGNLGTTAKQNQKGELGGARGGKMESYRLSASEISSSVASRSERSDFDPGSPYRSDVDLDAMGSIGDSAASIVLDQGKLKSVQTSFSNPAELSVVEGFSGSTVFLTGSTGYVGALVLEQLFRTCPGIRKVYLVIRDTKDRQGKPVPATDRLRKLLKGPEFHLLHGQIDSILARIQVISADLSTPGFGLSSSDRAQLCSETNYIIHCAASIRFDEPISDIMRTNYACTAELLKLATQMPYLRCFTYMSTAYVNSNQPRHSRIREEIYPLPGTSDPLAVAQELLELPPNKATKKAAKLMKQWKLQNTYFVAKTLSERLVMSYDNNPFPVCIVRPSLIGCVAGDPYPGYIGNTSGFTALVLGSLAGIIKFIQHDAKHHIAVVPGDVVSSATLAATIATAVSPGKLSNILHICSSDSYPLLNKNVHTTVGGYLDLDPVISQQKTLVRNGNYAVDWIKHRSTFNLRCFSRKVKLAAVAALLRLQGNARSAKKIMMAHMMWSKLGASTHDYNFTFETPTTDALYGLLPAHEQTLIKPVWREELGDSWIRYLRTYTAGVKHIYLKEAPLQTDQQDYCPR